MPIARHHGPSLPHTEKPLVPRDIDRLTVSAQHNSCKIRIAQQLGQLRGSHRRSVGKPSRRKPIEHRHINPRTDHTQHRTKITLNVRPTLSARTLPTQPSARHRTVKSARRIGTKRPGPRWPRRRWPGPRSSGSSRIRPIRPRQRYPRVGRARPSSAGPGRARCHFNYPKVTPDRTTSLFNGLLGANKS